MLQAYKVILFGFALIDLQSTVACRGPEPLMFSRLDYGAATLAGLPKQLLDMLQSVQNAADLPISSLDLGPRSHSIAQPTLCPCDHWRPCLPGGCCTGICLEQSAGVSTSITVRSRLKTD